MKNDEYELKEEEIEEIVSESLPAWKKICDSEPKEVILHQNDFGTSIRQFMLLAIAVKYAVRKDKTVTIVF